MKTQHTPYSTEIANPVDSFKRSFNRLCDEMIRKDIPVESELRSEMWREFASHYNDVLMSMHGYKSCYESMKEEFEKLKTVANGYVAELNQRSAAPELLEALTDAETILSIAPIIGKDDLLCKIRQVIKKAKGE